MCIYYRCCFIAAFDFIGVDDRSTAPSLELLPYEEKEMDAVYIYIYIYMYIYDAYNDCNRKACYSYSSQCSYTSHKIVSAMCTHFYQAILQTDYYLLNYYFVLCQRYVQHQQHLRLGYSSRFLEESCSLTPETSLKINKQFNYPSELAMTVDTEGNHSYDLN